MFGFLHREMESTGSEDRFPKRIEKFRKAEKNFPVLQHYFWWFIHNCVTHPLIGLIPVKLFFQFHDWTSVKLNAGEAALSTPLDDLEACRLKLLSVHDKLREISDNKEADSIIEVWGAMLLIEKDIEYHKQNKGTRANRLRRAARIIFKEK